MKLIVLEPAQKEVRDAIDYYNEHSSTAARPFVEEIRRSFAIIKAHPFRGPSTEEGERKYVVRTFPYTIVYRVTDTTVVVLAVAITAASGATGEHRMPVEVEITLIRNGPPAREGRFLCRAG